MISKALHHQFEDLTLKPDLFVGLFQCLGEHIALLNRLAKLNFTSLFCYFFLVFFFTRFEWKIFRIWKSALKKESCKTLKLAAIFHTIRTSLRSGTVDLRSKVKEHVSQFCFRGTFHQERHNFVLVCRIPCLSLSLKENELKWTEKAGFWIFVNYMASTRFLGQRDAPYKCRV